MTPAEQEKYNRARKSVEKLKGFYIHLAVYIIVNTVLLLSIFLRISDGHGNFWQAGHFLTPIFWGIGLFFHAMNTYQANPLFGRRWEERQIKKYMEEEREESGKYL